MTVTTRAVGAALDRIDGPAKVEGAARYAFEQIVDHPVYLFPLLATITVGRIINIDVRAAEAEPGVLAVLTHENAPRLVVGIDAELSILQSPEIAFHGQIIAGVIASTSESARHAAGLIQVDYDERLHDVALRAGRGDLVKPVNAANSGQGGGELQDYSPADTAVGDLDAGLASAAVRHDATYTTPRYDHNPMEPHSTIATWDDGALTIYCSTQGVHVIRNAIAPVLGLDPERIHLISPHVGGGFGSKVYAHADIMLAALAAQVTPNRPVKLALTRQQMFALVGYRTPTIQRIRLGAAADGRLTAIAHDVIEETSTLKEFAEQTGVCSRVMYAAPNRRTTHRLAALNVPPPTIMRAPGETPGMFALESAMDEMALACGLDPIEFRIRNEPTVHPETGLPFSSRHLPECLREGARRFGWQQRESIRHGRQEGRWLIGTGVAASGYPVVRPPGNAATIRVGDDGRYAVLIGAADIGTGTLTALTQIAADELRVSVDDVDLRIGDTNLPIASNAGFSSGINSWGTSIVAAAAKLRIQVESEHRGRVPPGGIEATAAMPDNAYLDQFAMHAFGAQFAEARVHEDTGEVRVRRLLGVFDVGRVINPKTARSQLIGGMTMGLSMALHEEGVFDPRFGSVVNQDFAEYHIAANADVHSVEAYWLDEEEDPYVNPMNAKGIGEIGIVGTAAAIANAVFDATGVRVRNLPITLDKLLG
jgi:xanthine dehydrogenase YagR molybdenum-binding subunit